MATLTGKKARKRLGNRYACKRAHRHGRVNAAKLERWRRLEDGRKRKGGAS